MTLHSPLRLALAATASATLACVAATAGAGTYNPSNLPSGEITRVGQVCESVLRVRPGEEHYDSCVESLSDSVRSLGAGRALGRARADCLSRGLKPGSPDLAVCELQSSRGSSPGAAGASLAAADEPGGGRSYFAVSPSDAFRREQLACAELGFDPAGGAFDSCATSLQTAMFAADNPMN